MGRTSAHRHNDEKTDTSTDKVKHWDLTESMMGGWLESVKEYILTLHANAASFSSLIESGIVITDKNQILVASKAFVVACCKELALPPPTGTFASPFERWATNMSPLTDEMTAAGYRLGGPKLATIDRELCMFITSTIDDKGSRDTFSKDAEYSGCKLLKFLEGKKKGICSEATDNLEARMMRIEHTGIVSDDPRGFNAYKEDLRQVNDSYPENSGLYCSSERMAKKLAKAVRKLGGDIKSQFTTRMLSGPGDGDIEYVSQVARAVLAAHVEEQESEERERAQAAAARALAFKEKDTRTKRGDPKKKEGPAWKNKKKGKPYSIKLGKCKHCNKTGHLNRHCLTLEENKGETLFSLNKRDFPDVKLNKQGSPLEEGSPPSEEKPKGDAAKPKPKSKGKAARAKPPPLEESEPEDESPSEEDTADAMLARAHVPRGSAASARSRRPFRVTRFADAEEDDDTFDLADEWLALCTADASGRERSSRDMQDVRERRGRASMARALSAAADDRSPSRSPRPVMHRESMRRHESGGLCPCGDSASHLPHRSPSPSSDDSMYPGMPREQGRALRATGASMPPRFIRKPGKGRRPSRSPPRRSPRIAIKHASGLRDDLEPPPPAGRVAPEPPPPADGAQGDADGLDDGVPPPSSKFDPGGRGGGCLLCGDCRLGSCVSECDTCDAWRCSLYYDEDTCCTGASAPCVCAQNPPAPPPVPAPLAADHGRL